MNVNCKANLHKKVNLLRFELNEEGGVIEAVPSFNIITEKSVEIAGKTVKLSIVASEGEEFLVTSLMESVEESVFPSQVSVNPFLDTYSLGDNYDLWGDWWEITEEE